VPRLSRKSGLTASSVSLNSNPIYIVGPTGVGKSLISVELASQFGGELVCADAYQVYRGLSLLTAQPGPELRTQVPHHLYGVVDPADSFDAAQFATQATQCITEVTNRGAPPFLVGGSGLYVRALTEGLDELPPVDATLRTELEVLTRDELRSRLEAADPEALSQIDAQNPRRIQRALEIVLTTGRPLAEARKMANKPRTGPPPRGIFVFREKSEMDERITQNVRAMFTAGVVEEVRSLGTVGPTASKAIGWREIHALLAGEMTETECIEAMILATRRYAKRQLTWFRNQTNFYPLNLTDLGSPFQMPRSALEAIALIV